MCGRYGLDGKKIDLEETFSVSVQGELVPRFNIAPTTPILVVKETPQGRVATFHVWGLIPPWAKDPGIGAKLINARAETAAEKPSFRNALKRRRCLVPASGFYEWQARESGGKQPFWIQPRFSPFLALAGLWETWHGPHGEELDSCTLLTTAPNEVIAPIHDRMPVILGPADFAEWLDSDETRSAGIHRLLRPCPADWLQAHPVGKDLGNKRFNLLAPCTLTKNGESGDWDTPSQFL